MALTLADDKFEYRQDVQSRLGERREVRRSASAVPAPSPSVCGWRRCRRGAAERQKLLKVVSGGLGSSVVSYGGI
jgi:hypothetical protein